MAVGKIAVFAPSHMLSVVFVCICQVEDTEESENDKCYCTAVSIADDEKDSDTEALPSIAHMFLPCATSSRARGYAQNKRAYKEGICMQGSHLTTHPNSS